MDAGEQKQKQADLGPRTARLAQEVWGAYCAPSLEEFRLSPEAVTIARQTHKQ